MPVMTKKERLDRCQDFAMRAYSSIEAKPPSPVHDLAVALYEMCAIMKGEIGLLAETDEEARKPGEGGTSE